MPEPTAEPVSIHALSPPHQTRAPLPQHEAFRCCELCNVIVSSARRKAPDPKPRLSRNSCVKPAAYTMSFLGTQPRNTQVPPAPPTESLLTKPKGNSQIATLAPARRQMDDTRLVCRIVLSWLQPGPVQSEAWLVNRRSDAPAAADGGRRRWHGTRAVF